MNPEIEAILPALMESRQILEAKMDALSTKLDAVAVTIKERVADMKARDEYLTHKTGELEAELFVIKRREKA